MFKIFICVLASLSAILIGYYLARKIINIIKNYFQKRKEMKKNEVILDKTELEAMSFEEKLFLQYKESCLELLKKQMQAAKIVDAMQDIIADYKTQAKKCKELYNNTNDVKYKNKAYFFLQEIDNSENLIELAKTTISDCKIKIDSAEIEYKAIMSKIRIKQFEYKLIGEGNNSIELMDKSEYESILSEYTKKIDVKKIDAKVDEAIEKQKALSAVSEPVFKLDELEKTYAEKFELI